MFEMDRTNGEGFYDAFTRYRREKRISIPQLAVLLCCSEKTIKRMKCEEPTFETVVAISIALHLSLFQCEYLLDLENYKFNSGIKSQLLRYLVVFSSVEGISKTSSNDKVFFSVNCCKKILEHFGFSNSLDVTVRKS